MRRPSQYGHGSYLPALIKQTRLALGEPMATFGKRFGNVAINTVSRWETGKNEAPYVVIEFVLRMTKHEFACPVCNGTGRLTTHLRT